jgi:hypothetical protein
MRFAHLCSGGRTREDWRSRGVGGEPEDVE